MDFAEAIDNSDLESFGFTDDFIFGKDSCLIALGILYSLLHVLLSKYDVLFPQSCGVLWRTQSQGGSRRIRRKSPPSTNTFEHIFELPATISTTTHVAAASHPK